MRTFLRFALAIFWTWTSVMGAFSLVTLFGRAGTTWFEQNVWWIFVLSLFIALGVTAYAHRAQLRDAAVQARILAMATPRHLWDDRHSSLVAALAGFPPQRLVLLSFEGIEDKDLVSEVTRALGNAGWHALRAVHDEARGITGMRVEVSASASKEEKDAAHALVAWLRAEKFAIDGPVENPERFSMTMLGRPLDDMALKLTIGTR